MHVITYSLRGNNTDSCRYYSDAALLTDEVMTKLDSIAGDMVEGLQDFICTSKAETLRSKEEYEFELLVLGVLWKVYSGDALELEDKPQQLLSGLARLRNQGGSLKPCIDFLRGILSTFFLSPDLYDNLNILEPTLQHFDKLLNWLEATGEFNQEVKRLRLWFEYLLTLSPVEAGNTLGTALALAIWFENRSMEIMKPYTENVDRFLNELRPEHYWCEDVIFCGRRRVEYHLNMIGAEIMNRAYRKDFLSTTFKMVVVPACMRLLPDKKCKACMSGNEQGCLGCADNCLVFQLTRLGRENCFDVIVVSHESSLEAKVRDNDFISKDVGVIGVACVLNLVSGGWALRDMGIPAQCVLLDYCGCRNHWHKEGFPTEINIDRLKFILGDKSCL